MAQTLLSSFGKSGENLGLQTLAYDIDDTSHLSKYFSITEFDSILTAGRNPVAFNGSDYLANNSEIKVECLDSNGNSLFIEQIKSANSQFTDSSRFVISIHIYAEAYNGPGKLILAGVTKKGELVRWIGKITIDKTLTNKSKVRFYSTPTISARSLLYPVVNLDYYSQAIPPVSYKYPSATAVLTGVVYTIDITNGGSGYTSPPNVNISGNAAATATIQGGIVNSIVITNNGTGYTSDPTVTFSGGNPSTIATANANFQYAVKSITIINGGSGYATPPAVLITGPATAVAEITNGAVTNITVTDGGYGYSYIPSVGFSDPRASSANSTVINIPVSFAASCHAFAATPHSNTNILTVDRKRTEVDYRIVADIPESYTYPSMLPTGSFNTQMEGSSITINVTKILLPPSQRETIAIDTNIVNKTFVIKKVIDSKTIILNDPFYYKIGKDKIITDIAEATFTSSYNFVQYNTNKESNLLHQSDITSKPVPVQASYAEIIYRNIKPYSGFVARHKLYKRSLAHPGGFQLVSDEPLKSLEILSDNITFNKAYPHIGSFYNQFHAEKYWISSDPSVISITAKTFPINSGYIHATNLSDLDGGAYIIVKTDSIGIDQDNVYYPYNQAEFNDLSGSSYNSNFISLKKNILYVLSTNVIMEKNLSDTTANISFYFTSSIPEIKLEKTFNSNYGLKLGEVSTTDHTKIKYFSGNQVIYFTPSQDYYGTLVVVPYHCNVTLSDVSLKIYGDYGFSPDLLLINIPFPVNVKNEAFELKAELFDVNSNMVFSDLKTNQTFDITGDSINTTSNLSSVAFNSSDPTSATNVTTTIISSINATDNLYLPNLQLSAGKPSRLVGWIFPDGSPDSNKLIYTNISDLSRIGQEYINLTTVSNGISSTARSISVKYTGSVVNDGTLTGPFGRRIWIDSAGSKTTYS